MLLSELLQIAIGPPIGLYRPIPKYALAYPIANICQCLFCARTSLDSLIWVFQKNRGGPPKWMVYNGSNPIKMDDLGGPPLLLETPKYDVDLCIKIVKERSNTEQFQRLRRLPIESIRWTNDAKVTATSKKSDTIDTANAIQTVAKMTATWMSQEVSKWL